MRRVLFFLGVALLGANAAVAAESLSVDSPFTYKQCGYQVGETQGYCTSLVDDDCQNDSECVRE
ncbi:MAG: hypothetical protein U5R14_15390 [Gemmatimonadota bacterium]|nr:hypothetical protein [Gemmatimonadota bacterium]